MGGLGPLDQDRTNSDGLGGGGRCMDGSMQGNVTAIVETLLECRRRDLYSASAGAAALPCQNRPLLSPVPCKTLDA